MYTYPNNPRANKALIAAAYAGVENIELVDVEMGVTNKTEHFLNLNPFGKVPTLETPDGGLFESNAIARFVARQTNNNLFGESPFEAGQVEQWVDWVRGDLELAASVWLYPIYGFIQNNPAATLSAKKDIQSYLEVLNGYLEGRSFLVGDHVTLADIVVSCTLVPLYTMVFDDEYRAAFPNVTQWFVKVTGEPKFVAVQGEIKLCGSTELDVEDSNESKTEEVKEEPILEAGPSADNESNEPKIEEPLEVKQEPVALDNPVAVSSKGSEPDLVEESPTM